MKETNIPEKKKDLNLNAHQSKIETMTQVSYDHQGCIWSNEHSKNNECIIVKYEFNLK